MTSNVEPEEVQALMGLMRESGQRRGSVVTERDFRHPKRLSADSIEDIERSLATLLPRAEHVVGEALGCPTRLALAGVSEVSADTILDDVLPPLAALRFRFHGQLAWILWDARAAVSAVERIMGSSSTDPEARELSRTECRVLGNMLASLARLLAEVFARRADDFVVALKPETFGSWRDDEDQADPHRVAVELRLETGGSEPGPLWVFLPGFHASTAGSTQETQDGPPPALPDHLDRVEVDLLAHFPAGDLPLSQLLALEEGDVIPLEARVGDPVRVSIEDRPFGHGGLGTHRGRVAIRMESIEFEDRG